MNTVLVVINERLNWGRTGEIGSPFLRRHGFLRLSWLKLLRAIAHRGRMPHAKGTLA
jgi:hypothetical protein